MCYKTTGSFFMVDMKKKKRETGQNLQFKGEKKFSSFALNRQKHPGNTSGTLWDSENDLQFKK